MFPEATDTGFGRNLSDDSRVAASLAMRLRNSRASLSLRWLERIAARVTLPENEVFPTQDLLDHVPVLIESIADYMETPAEDGPGVDRILAKAAELGEMRFQQGFSPYQILKEFELLGGIVLSYLARAADQILVECPPGEFLLCAQRVHRTLAIIQQATAARYLAMLETRASEREQRLRALNEILSGPLSQRLEDALAAARQLEAGETGTSATLSHDLRARLERVGAAVDQLRLLSRIDPAARMQRNVSLQAAIAESIRVVRDAALERGIEILIPEPLPPMEVNAAAVELATLVFLNSLLRYGEPTGSDRRIEVVAELRGGDGVLMVEVSVRDLGARMPENARRALLGPRREDSVSDDAPAAISMEIAREAIEGFGGRITLRDTESPASTEFVLALPSRRARDVAAEG